MLFIVATPIGNLSDITFRAIETLKSCDYILCEDTRHSLTLLQHYAIHKPLKSYHKFNESARQDETINDLIDGKNVALISDAGTPGISDPGAQLIAACISQNIKVVAIPGACAAIAALCCSGLETDRFQFWGFLPKKQGELKRSLYEILAYSGTTVCYESPNRLLDVLEILNEIAPDRPLAVARELTKKFEEIQRGVAMTLLQHWKSSILKGEIVLLISGEKKEPMGDWEDLTPLQHVEIVQTTYGLTKQEAIQTVAKIRGSSKRDIYNSVHRSISPEYKS
ncbi:MAG: 16S rRNA (cytidine(1402)-2'-O)-methyltransferase [Parachlamydiaceae bacterium]|nr:16S rRNA (cytidine(1402)-2'-O)-methyltransferase [Parachlamydiaceae bacterium]